MATLYVAEFPASSLLHGPVPIVQGTPIAEQTVSIGGSSTSSSAFAANTKIIRVHTDAICSIAIGASPTATAAKMRMAAGTTEYFEVAPTHKIAVITNT